MGQGMDGMNESWDPEDVDETAQRRVNTLLPEPQRLRIESDGLFKRAKKAEEKNKALTAERDQLRAEVNRLQGYNESLLQERDSRITTVAGLRRVLEEINDAICVTRPSDIANGVLKAFQLINAALAASPDEHERRIKAEALREFAKSRDIEVVGNGDWYAGIAAERTATVDDLRDTADRLEKEATHGH